MATEPFVIERFGALNLTDDPTELGPAGGATDLVNVDFDKRGRLRTRDGFTRAKALTMTAEEGLAVYDGIVTKHFVVGYTNGGTSTYAAYTAAGGAAVASTAVSAGSIGAVQFGTPTVTRLYLTNGLDTVWRWSGAAFSQPAGMPIASFLATNPARNRLVAGALGSSVSRVKFSDAGDAETWPATNFIDLAPGDSFITSLQNWQNLLFVFKANRFFVFYGESVDGGGNPVFNYRTIDGFGGYGAIAGDEGVYFGDGRTIWLTTGDIPRRVSEPIEPFLRGIESVNGETVSQSTLLTHRYSYSLGRLYVSMTTSGGSRRTLVYDPKLNTWTLYSLSVSFARTMTSLSSQDKTFWLSTSGVESFDGAATDNGSDISWSHKSGKYPLSDPGRVAVTLESSVTGYSTTGTVSLGIDTDSFTGIGGTATISGTPPVPVEGYVQKDQEGKLFQHTLSGTVPTTISRVTHYVSFVKPAGVQ